MKKRVRKLALAKETVRSLVAVESHLIVGGLTNAAGTCGTGYCGESNVCSGACWSNPLYSCPPQWEPLETTDCP